MLKIFYIYFENIKNNYIMHTRQLTVCSYKLRATSEEKFFFLPPYVQANKATAESLAGSRNALKVALWTWDHRYWIVLVQILCFRKASPTPTRLNPLAGAPIDFQSKWSWTQVWAPGLCGRTLDLKKPQAGVTCHITQKSSPKRLK